MVSGAEDDAILTLLDVDAHIRVAGVEGDEQDGIFGGSLYAGDIGVVAAAGDEQGQQHYEDGECRQSPSSRGEHYPAVSGGLGVTGRRNETVTAEMTNRPAMTVNAVW